MQHFTTITGLRISLASPEEIRSWSYGEVTRPDTINYLTRQPEKSGLFCERIFGPVRDWTCACGTYRSEQQPGLVCETCGVEVAPRRVRRERMGHIELAAPVAHPWFARATPSILAILLNLSPRQLTAVLACSGYLVTHIQEDARREVLASLDDKQAIARSCRLLLKTLAVGDFLAEAQYRDLLTHSGGSWWCAKTGGEALRSALQALNLEMLASRLEQDLRSEKGNQQQLLRRLRVVEAFRSSGVDPSWMMLSVLPVLPPDPASSGPPERRALRDLRSECAV